jgi:hypothetical protein
MRALYARPFYQRKKRDRHPLNRRHSGTHSRPGHYGEKEHTSPSPGLERFHGCPVHNPVTILPELSRFTPFEYQAISLQAWTGRYGSRKLRLPKFVDNRHIKVARLSALRTGGLYTTGNIPGTHFCQRMSRHQGHTVAGRILMKNSKDLNPRPSGLKCSASTNCATTCEYKYIQTINYCYFRQIQLVMNKSQKHT